MGIDNGVALVAGGNGDIGQAICRRLGEAGHTLVVSCLSTAKADVALAQLAESGISATSVILDVRDDDSCKQAIAEIVARHGGLSTLVNCAGVSYIAPVLIGKTEEWQRVVDVNTMGAFRLCRAALRPMIRRRSGRIIHVGSISAEVGAPYNAIYAASKAAVGGMVRSLALEVAGTGITVNAVQPGYVKTKLFAQTQSARARIKGVTLEQHEQDLVDDTPTGRLVTPEDVASLVNYLATDESQSITGQALNVDGGRTAN
ncbi:MAG: SDR family NAD(P)-dependent oxidoreductase [Pseudomonadota bacterium]